MVLAQDAARCCKANFFQGKALRTVKSCVGSTWCRYGIGDSVGCKFFSCRLLFLHADHFSVAISLEERYKGVRSPHKLKGGVSGCVRECAEAQSKDFGLIATDKGWNSKAFIYHLSRANFCVKSSWPVMAVPTLDMPRYLRWTFHPPRLYES